MFEPLPDVAGQLTVNCRLPETSVGADGWAGRPALSVPDSDQAPVPLAWAARTWISWVVPFVRPVTVDRKGEGTVAASTSMVGCTLSVLPLAVSAIQKWVLAGNGRAVCDTHASALKLWPYPAVRSQSSEPWVFMLLVVGAVGA